MSTDPDALPWERQKGESAQAFEAFQLYRDAGADRAVRAVARTLGKSGTLIAGWSSKKAWVARCRAFDADQDKRARAAADRAREDMARRHAQLAVGMQTKAVARIAGIKAEDLTPREVSEWVKTAVAIERAARGEADRHEVTGRDGGPVQIEGTAPFVVEAATLREILKDQAELETERLVKLEKARAAGQLTAEEE